ncbi:MAG TPA: Rne/Rng family ribonuclease [Thermoanaerobaculia bacterium]|nr:Rne/Rng family ribonuclease [Thermoanaerobaculia bacterium]
MSRKMLINAQRPEELRIAIVEDGVLEDYQVDVAEAGVTRGNIYRGVIANIQPSLNAAFIDYGIDRHGFLAIQDVVPDAYYHQPKGHTPRIEEVLERGKPIVVQVAKDAIGSKGASLTTSLSLAGRYLVLTPFEDTRGVSRKVEDDDTRKKLKVLAAGPELPDGCGIIVRTNALGQTKATLQRDLAALLRLWKRVQSAAVDGRGVRLLYTDQDLIFQALRDRLDASIEELLVDDDEAFQKAQAYMQAFMPRAKTKLIRYTDRLPLFSRFQLEPQIDRIYDRTVPLPSGGSLVIDATEALTAIDINSGRSTRAATQEETALHTNLEAAAEVARHLRLRDIGGLVVVDFIDMRASKYQRRVEKALRDAMKDDKARSTVGRISPNGLLEINRQRIQQALQVRTHRPCPTCNGMGRLASPEMVTLNLLRRVEERAAAGTLQGVRIGLHPELADAMQNSRRRELAALEEEFDLKIEIIAAAGLHRPDQQIEWFQREKPVTPRRTKPAPSILRPWDMALPGPAEDDFDEEDEEPAPAAAKPAKPAGRQPRSEPRQQRQPRQARPEPHPLPADSGQAETEEEKRSRKRRRGGRKRKKGGAGVNVAAGDGNGDGEPAFTDGAAPEGDGMDHDFVEGDSEEGGLEAEGGGGRSSNKRRRRRKRRGGARHQGDDAPGAAPEPSEPPPPTVH